MLRLIITFPKLCVAVLFLKSGRLKDKPKQISMIDYFYILAQYVSRDSF